MFKKFFIFFLVSVFICCIQTIGFAFEALKNIKDTLEESLEEGSVIGMGALYQQRPYKKVDSDIYPVPIISLEYKRFFIDETIFGFHLLDTDEFKFSIVGAPRFWGYDADDSTALNGMQDRKASFDGGLRARWKNKFFTFTLTGLTDLLDEHQGQEVDLSLSKELWGRFLTPHIGVRWFSKDLVDYYYGVKSSEVTATRPAYEPDDTLNYVAGLTIAIPLGERWALITDVQYELLGDEIEDSPIVDEDGISRYLVGIVYRF
jgi:outer membrane protein